MLIIGAGNLGKHVIDQLIQDGYPHKIVFFDENNSQDKIYNQFHVISSWDDFYSYLKETNNCYFIAVGNPRIRKKIYSKIKAGNYTSLISKYAGIVSGYSTFGEGSMIQPGCCISHNVKTGISCLIHAGTLIGHDVVINDFVSIGSNVNILKDVYIDSFSIISPNVLIYPNVRIGKNVFIGPGVIIKEDVPDFETITL